MASTFVEVEEPLIIIGALSACYLAIMCFIVSVLLIYCLLLRESVLFVYCCCVVAIDISEAQNSLLQLKIAAIQHLCYKDFLILLGEAEDSSGRW